MIRNVLYSSGAALALAILGTGAARAQEAAGTTTAEPNGGEFGDIVVTANRRAESAQNVGIAINAIGGQAIADLKITNSSDIAKLAPGVTATGAQGGFLQTFSIRGVTQNDYNPHQESPVAAYIDDVYISSLQGQSFAVFDTDRIEILKGPQGTLFGRNATGGLVNYVTTKPELGSMNGYIDADYGSFNQVDVSAALNVPLGEKVAVRASGVFSRRDPALHNQIGPDQWDARMGAGRLHVLLQPSDDFKMLFSARYGRTSTTVSAANQYLSSIGVYDGAGNQLDNRLLGATETAQVIVGGAAVGSRPCPGCDFFGYRDPDGPGRITSDSLVGNPVSATTSPGENRTFSEAYGATTNLEGGSGPITVNLITDYSHFKWRVGSGLTGGANFPFGFDTLAKGIDQMSGELRVSGNHDSFRWTAGAYYLYVQSNNQSAFGDPTGVVFGVGRPADQTFAFRQKTSSLSGFVQAEYDILPNLTVIGGVRQIHETKKFGYVSNLVLGNGTVLANLYRFDATTNPGDTPSTNNLTAWKAGLNFHPVDDLLLYATVNRGVKAGGYNAPSAPSTAIPFTFGPEVLMAYEGGFKSTLLDRTLTLNGSAFYYDYQNYQAYASIGTTNYLLNSKARNYGAEMQLSARPIPESDALQGHAARLYRAEQLRRHLP